MHGFCRISCFIPRKCAWNSYWISNTPPLQCFCSQSTLQLQRFTLPFNSCTSKLNLTRFFCPFKWSFFSVFHTLLSTMVVEISPVCKIVNIYLHVWDTWKFDFFCYDSITVSVWNWMFLCRFWFWFLAFIRNSVF